MKTYFDNGAVMEFSNKGPQGAGYSIRIAKDSFCYKSLNGKIDADVKFAEIGGLDLTDYCSQNAGYKVRLRDLNMRDMGLPELELDTIPCDNAHNIRESKPLLIAFAASKLGAEFPNNLFSLDAELGETPGEQRICLSYGVIRGAKHQVKLADIKRVKCVCKGAQGELCVYTKAKGGFFDMPNMKLPINEITLPLLEAAVTRNSGKGIDFSKGRGFDRKDSEYVIIRYMDSGFFVSRDGSALEPWQEIAYHRIKAYNYDVDERWGIGDIAEQIRKIREQSDHTQEQTNASPASRKAQVQQFVYLLEQLKDKKQKADTDREYL